MQDEAGGDGNLDAEDGQAGTTLTSQGAYEWFCIESVQREIRSRPREVQTAIRPVEPDFQDQKDGGQAALLHIEARAKQTIEIGDVGRPMTTDEKVIDVEAAQKDCRRAMETE